MLLNPGFVRNLFELGRTRLQGRVTFKAASLMPYGVRQKASQSSPSLVTRSQAWTSGLPQKQNDISYCLISGIELNTIPSPAQWLSSPKRRPHWSATRCGSNHQPSNAPLPPSNGAPEQMHQPPTPSSRLPFIAVLGMNKIRL